MGVFKEIDLILRNEEIIAEEAEMSRQLELSETVVLVEDAPSKGQDKMKEHIFAFWD